MKELFCYLIPDMFQRFVRCKGLKRRPGYAGKLRSVKVQVQIETMDLFRAQRRLVLSDKACNIFWGQAEYKTETQWCTLSPDNMQAEFADIFPAGILRQFCIGVKEIFLYETVYMKCIKCYNLSFYKRKIIKSVF